MKVLVFGPISGFSSYPVVMRGLIGAFRKLGVEVVTADISGPCSDLTSQEVREVSLGRLPEDLDVDLVFAMKPSSQMVKLTDQGPPLVGLHVGDVSEIPQDWKLAMEKEALVVVPSTWGKHVIESTSNIKTPICVSNHGIEDIYLGWGSADARRPKPGPVKFLHFCSSGSYPERKGTPQALSAFKRIVEQGFGAELTLMVFELKRPLKNLLGQLPGHVREKILVCTRYSGIAPQEMIGLYTSHDFLLAPSRAEGFGIMPLEARALGVPVIQTLCTGHSDHGITPETAAGLGVVVVDHGPLVPAWGGMGMAPEVEVEAVYEAMRTAIQNIEELFKKAHLGAPLMAEWSWVEVTRDLVKEMEELC